ncbi:hypothetical protein DEO72_LG2g4382 [Vigna unguiculata]|uniref:Uncharacterized protein n=1 Tax=Vigna unguiculata TaxID=3917 RepID=A0A4D6L668_VIGUN|nr:hypothetical protein DEO72_LG2g4382 [Vigna unguiculata]
MATYQIKSTQKPITFSHSEIEAAKQLIQLSSGDSEEDHQSSNNSCSYSVVQGKPRQSKVDSGGDVSSVAETAVDSQDESFAATTTKRYRCVKDLYSVTEPVPATKAKKKRNTKTGAANRKSH